MLLTELHYDLPDNRIARYPLEQRDASKLLVYQNGQITDSHFSNLQEHLPNGAALVLNETRVVEARLAMLTEHAQPIEMFLLEPTGGLSIEQALLQTGEARYKVLVKPKKKWKEQVIAYADSDTPIAFKATWADREQDEVNLLWEPAELTLAEVMHRIGKMPLPPYLKREPTVRDTKAYQTVFARRAGAVAAPTASLHFTPELLAQLGQNGTEQIPLTLHVGAGTFMPVKTDRLEDHLMHGEYYSVSIESLKKLVAKETLIAVGTTALRTLESLYWRGCHLLATGNDVSSTSSFIYRTTPPVSKAEALNALIKLTETHGADVLTGTTSLFVLPGCEVKMVSGIITNFHQPDSTLLALVEALIGKEWHRIYAHALANGYRFLSYGDSSLLLF